MLVKDVMTKNVLTAPSSTSLGEAKKLMKEHKFRRLPVVDENGDLVGMVNEGRLERVVPPAPAPLWQVNYLIHQTTLRDIMEKDVVTVAPEATVEQAVLIAQSRKVGALVVVKDHKVVGIATTNDFFYNVVNPILGIGEPGTRILVSPADDSKSVGKVTTCIGQLDIEMTVLWKYKELLVIHIDIDDATDVLKELQALGFSATIRPR